MVLRHINGIEIDFPYEPYGAQIRYMWHVVEALRGGSNALLESPTGTGKTLCLLCAALAWRSTYVAALQANANCRPDAPTPTGDLLHRAGLQPPVGAASALTALVRPDLVPQLSVPKIVYASRTHSQLSQVVAELKKTVYKPAMALLASRDQLCIHGVSSSLSGSRLNAKCRQLTAPARRSGRCQYHAPIASSKPHENRSTELVEKLHSKPPMDIEDLRGFGEGEGACPYYLSRASAKSDECEILFLPYNYLLDRSARASLGIDWSNDIVIIDEAHNLEPVCSESMSFNLSDSVRKACDAELGALIEHAVRPGGVVIPALEDLAKTEKGLEKVIGSENCEINEIRLMRTILRSLEDFIDTVQFDRGEEGDVAFRVFEGGHLRKTLEQAGGPTVETYELFLEMLDRAMGVQAEKSKQISLANERQTVPHSTSGVGNAITLLQSAFRVLFESVSEGHENFFRTVVQQSKSKPAAGRTISYWCFKPAIAMKNIRHLNMRCLLLTSGTLSPMDSFATELGLDFPVQLENPHVVTKPQIWAGVIKSGPEHQGVKGGRLTSAFNQRGDASYLELGRSLIKIASIVPDGMLVFFPSYGSMYSCIDAWKRLGPGTGGSKPSVWEHLMRHKGIVAEEKESSKFTAAILAHRANVDSRKGSILMAVCRGKVSEGIDFSDEYGRAVVITGLPFPSAFDPRVVLKREISDEEAQSSRQRARGESQAINGSEWYKIQALRAVNQAVGRAIRHRHDYGAIILCEERFQSKQLQQQVSKWIRPSLAVCPSFQTAEQSLGDFFASAVQSSFAKEGEEKRLETRRRRMANKAQGKREEDAAAVLIAQEAISRLLPAPKTEKEFLQEVLSLSDELKLQKRTKNEPKERTTGHEIPKFNILDFNTETAKSGLRDSGAHRTMNDMLDQRERTEVEVKRSAAFLASRAERLEQGACKEASIPLQTNKRIRLMLPPNAASSTASLGTASKVPLSQRIKTMFASKKEVQQFLTLFREVINLQKKVKEGEGPLMSQGELKQCLSMAELAIARVVSFVVEHSVKESQDAFLLELRSKIPGSFRKYFDTAMSSN